MAREYLFIEEISQFERPSFEVIQSTHADVVVDTFVQLLREIFSRHPLYTYIAREDSEGPDFEQTQIVITDKYTEDAVFLPIITTSFNSSNTHWIQFSQSPFDTVLKPQYNPDGSIKRDELGKPVPSHYEYTGAYDSSVTFTISANDTLEREELTNLLHVLFVEVLRDELLLRGIFVKNVNTGGQTEQPFRNNYIYQVPVTVEIYSEWKRKVPVGDTLLSIGFDMNVDEGLTSPAQTQQTVTFLPIHDLKNEFFVEDPSTGENVIPELLLSATSEQAPVTLVYNTMTTRWEVSQFWKAALEATLLPYENFRLDLNKPSSVGQYLQHAGKAIIQAIKLRALSLSQGRTLLDGTKVIQQAFVYQDQTVELKGGIDKQDPLIYSTTVQPDNTVIIRFIKSNKNRNILIARNVILDDFGQVQSGKIYKRYTDPTGTEVEKQLFTTDEIFLSSENLNTMSAVDLFLIMQFADQPFKYTLSRILKEIDNLLEQLADSNIAITNRMQKISNITNVKQDLIVKTERFLLLQPIGL